MSIHSSFNSSFSGSTSISSINSNVSPTVFHKALTTNNFDRFIEEQIKINSQTENDELVSAAQNFEQHSSEINTGVDQLNPQDDQNFHQPDAASRIKLLEDSMYNVLAVNIKLKEELDELREQLNDTFDSIYYLEKDLYQFQQYGRRESIEITGIPENIPQNELEMRMIDLLRRIGVHNLSSYEIAACHRLKKNRNSETSNVIIRFINRKRAYQALINRRFIKFRCPSFSKAFIVESLCPTYKKNFETLSELRKEDKVKQLWSHNGSIFFKKTSNDKPKKITHISDMDYHFTDWEKHWRG